MIKFLSYLYNIEIKKETLPPTPTNQKTIEHYSKMANEEWGNLVDL